MADVPSTPAFRAGTASTPGGGEVRRAAGRFAELVGATGSPLPPWWEQAHLDICPYVDVGSTARATGLAPTGSNVDERFRVERDDDGSIRVRARSEHGLFLALVRLWLDPEGVVSRGGDGPRFSWRGLSLDVVRWAMPEGVIHQVIDLLALHGFTVLHLHLTDHQGWRAPVPSGLEIPDRIDEAAYARLLEHAERRYVTVVPELDMPGHTAALVSLMPELGAGRRPLHPYLTYLDPRSAVVRAAVVSLISELAAITPGPYLHVGGDEAFSMPEDLYADFLELSTQAVRDAGKKPLSWQELARSDARAEAAQVWTSRSDLPAPGSMVAALPDDFAEVGRAVEAALGEAVHDPARLAARSTPVIISEQDPYYLDRRYLGRAADPAQANRLTEIGFPAYAPRSLEDVWRFDPERSEAAEAGVEVAGVECAIWTESVTCVADLVLLLLPRLALVGERAHRGGPAPALSHARRLLRASVPLWDGLGMAGAYRDEDWV